MKVAFRQQASEYDCVPTTLINALSYLFERKEVPPLVIQRIYLYSLDSTASNKALAHGTSEQAIQLLGEWLSNYDAGDFKVDASYHEGPDVSMDPNGAIIECLKNKGSALLRVTHQNNSWHYVLGLSVADNWLHCYDPYERSREHNKENGYEFIREEGNQSPNFKINLSWLNENTNRHQYRLGKEEERACLLIKRKLQRKIINKNKP